MTTKNQAKLKSSSSDTDSSPTLRDHLGELRNRLFAIVVVFLLCAGAAYPLFDQITKLLLAPLGQDQQLVYLTPGGAFGFIIQVCLYVGLIGVLPVLVYNLHRFIMPALKTVRLTTTLGYTLASVGLAVIGVLFSYFVSLPAALHFLTNFNLYHINPMLTVDAYLSFVMAYLVAGALLFQLPLLMLIINSGRPLKPSKLMAFQPYILLISFVVAAIITPTPDVLNQTLLAAPIVVMYQVGIVLVLLRNRRKKPHALSTAPAKPNPLPQPAKSESLSTVTPITSPQPLPRPREVQTRSRVTLSNLPRRAVIAPPRRPRPLRPQQAMDVFVPSRYT